MKNEYSYDVVVMGGGPSGVAAAVACSRAGAKVALAERYGFCGGMATAGGVAVYANQPAGDQNLAGPIYRRFIESLIEAGGAYASDDLDTWVAVNIEDARRTFDMILYEVGVKVLYHVALADVNCLSRSVKQIRLVGKSGQMLTVKAKVFIDATGDADLAFLAGAETRSQTDMLQPMTMMFRVGMVDIEKAVRNGAELRGGKYLWWPDGNEALLSYTDKARAEGRWPSPKKMMSLIWSDPRCPQIVNVNGTRISGLDGSNSLDLSTAEIMGREQAKTMTDFMREYLPGFEHVGLIATGPQIGVRETRRIAAQYELTEDDVLECRQFPDQIAQGAYPIDVHLPNSNQTDFRELPKGKSYGIPYRCLVPRDLDNVLVPGRAMSATHVAAGAIRVMPICMTTGEMAGRCAAWSILHHVAPTELDIATIKQISG